MLTQAPLPNITSLLRSFLRRRKSLKELLSPWCGKDDTAGYLSRSGWSFALIARWRQQVDGSTSIAVWVPDYFCNESLAALRSTGVDVVFYPVKPDMEPDISACRKMAACPPPSIFVVVHYFGKPIKAADAREFCKQKNAWLIEDAAHVLMPQNDVGRYGDFIVYSPHKLLPIPDGAVLVIRKGGASKFDEGIITCFGPPEQWVQQLRDLGKSAGVSVLSLYVMPLLWLLKRLIQKTLPNLKYQISSEFQSAVESQSLDLRRFGLPSASNLSMRLLAVLSPDFDKICRKRQRNQLVWDALLSNERVFQCEEVAAAERPVIREWIPYLSSYQVLGDSAESVYSCWVRNKLPASSWPDLPGEIMAEKELHGSAFHLRQNRIFLPVHQSIDVGQIVSQFPDAKRPNLYSFQIVVEWDKSTPDQWNKWLEQAGRSSLLQSWSYGEAKSEASGWYAKRGLIRLNDEPIAVVQVLQRKIMGLFTISRINRGPLPLRELTVTEKMAVLRELSSLGNILRGRVLSIASEEMLTGHSLVMMERLGYRQFSPNAYESIWLDLSLDLDELRSRLNGKWRNALKYAENSQLDVDIGASDEHFDWVLSKYKSLMDEKEFSGVPVTVLSGLKKHLPPNQPLTIIRVSSDGEVVGGICVALHGSAATYLIGWNGSRGRNLKANQYLLWQAVKHLKQLGVKWFDLGGISEEHTPGISAFKLGMNGERYELIGEYWRW